MNATADIELATVLQAGRTPDVVLLLGLGKMLPEQLRAQFRETIAVLQVVHGLTQAPGPVAARLAFSQQLDAVARGAATLDFAPEWDGLADSFRSQGPFAADLLQAAQRELSFAARNEPVLFPSWSDFYSHARFSTVPVGRALFTAAQLVDSAPVEPMDALMTALALTAALQTAPLVYRQRGVVGLPMQWLAAESLDADALGSSRSNKAMRQVFSRGVDRAFELLTIAGPTRTLPLIGDHAAGVSLLSRRVLRRLQRRDPLARPVALGLFDYLALRLANIGQLSH